MKKSISASLAGLLIVIATGCTPVKFYSNEGLSQKTGLRYYTVKPYILAERNPENNVIVKATVIYLPDLLNLQYMVVKTGPGSNKVNLKLTDGTLNTFGVESDTKIAATLESLATLISKSAAVVTDKSMPLAATATNITELYEVIMTPEGTILKKVNFE
jgi:hypothetical protein